MVSGSYGTKFVRWWTRRPVIVVLNYEGFAMDKVVSEVPRKQMLLSLICLGNFNGMCR